MKIYREFHGQIPLNLIGKRLREIVRLEKVTFKIMTGYGASSGQSLSKSAAINSLTKMVKEGLIGGFLPGEARDKVFASSSIMVKMKQQFEQEIKHDPDYGNDGIIFIFIKK